ncbi:hypothetical protein A3N95_01115 [Mycobacteroides abscessus]|nr:hypothetical protein A3N95_01115 [Mycobacteroides abscessus]
MLVARQKPVRRTDLQRHDLRVPGRESLHCDAATFQAIRLDTTEDTGPIRDPLATSADSAATVAVAVGTATAADSAMAAVDATAAAEGKLVRVSGLIHPIPKLSVQRAQQQLPRR